MKKSNDFVSRRQFLKMVAAAYGTVALSPLLQACGGGAGATMSDWSKPPDIEKAKEQAKEFYSYGVPDDWANYGEVIQLFGKQYGFNINHIDTDMTSLEEITKFDAEKNNPVGIIADIGLMYGSVAEKKGVVPPYLPPNADKLPAGYKAQSGGWVSTFIGVPAFVVNTDVVKNVPKTWKDLLNPEYKGMVSSCNVVGGGGEELAIFLAWAYANGGDELNLDAAVEFAKQMNQQSAQADADVPNLEKGEVPIQMLYDFNCISEASQVKEKGVNATVVIPPVTIYGPLGLMINKYNLAKMDVAKLFINFVLSDDGQTTFAKFGARPIRYVLGDLKLPDEAKINWLPDDLYANVIMIKDWNKVDAVAIMSFYQDKVLGG